MARYQIGDFYRQPASLHGSTHPVLWLRIQFLVERAQRRGYHGAAEEVVEQWQEIASLLSVTEDYHGFYTDSLKPILVRTLDDMLVELSPRECTAAEAEAAAWEDDPSNVAALLNRVWHEYSGNSSGFDGWEAQVLAAHYGLGSK
jgi:hypothetical protein